MRIANTAPVLGMIVAAALLGGELVGALAYRYVRAAPVQTTVELQHESAMSIRLRDLEDRVEQLKQRVYVDHVRLQLLDDELMRQPLDRRF